MSYGLIFDMDGVLIDSAEPHFESWRALAAEHDIEMTREFFTESFGLVNWEILPRLFGRAMTPEEMEPLAERKEVIYRDLIRGKVPFPHGLSRLIDDLQSKGWRFAIGSSGPRLNVEMIINELNLGQIISAYTCCEDVSRGKPNPQVFLKTADKMKLAPSHCVVVEDSLHGVEAAHRAGMACIAVTATYPRRSLQSAEMIIDSFEDISGEDVEKLITRRIAVL